MRRFRLALVGLALLLPACAGPGTRAGDYAGLPRPEARRAVVLAGLEQVGTPYVYGGAAAGEGLDCSGLTHVAHLAAGVRIPRVSEQQRRGANRVVARRPGPGDLVFFRIGPSEYHVGLMIDRRRFVHASTTGGRVQVTHLDAPYWQQRFLGAGTYLY